MSVQPLLSLPDRSQPLVVAEGAVCCKQAEGQADGAAGGQADEAAGEVQRYGLA